MLSLLTILCQSTLSALKTRKTLVIENLALRQQLFVLQRSAKRPQISNADRLFWICLARCSKHWRELLCIVTPDTVVRWHRAGFRRYWAWRSRRHGGRPSVDPEIRKLIRRMSMANPLWGAPRLHGELLKLGIDVSQATVSKYMKRGRKPPSQTWRTFLNNHAKDIVAIDFFTVPTATFRILYVLVVLSHKRRHIVHFNVTEHPTDHWVAQQIVEAFPFDTTPRYLLRDRDRKYGSGYAARVESLGVGEVIIAPRSPWQNPYVERVIGSIRRDFLDHVIILNERHLRRLLREYVSYYHNCRTHLSLNKDTPAHRAVEPPETGNIVAFPHMGGLHHRYMRLAA